MYTVKKKSAFLAYPEYTFHYLADFLVWWFVKTPVFILKSIIRANTILDDSTSFRVVLLGYFRPWKNDFNIAGWFVGIIIKTVYLAILFVCFAMMNLILLALFALQIAFLPVIIGLIILSPFIGI